MKKKLVSIMLVAAMALSVAACGSSKGNSAKTDGTEAMASSVSKTPDNQISINLASEPQSIDPALNSAVDGGCMIVNSFAGLYTYDKDGKLIPQLASDMPEVSDDETVYTVKMIKSQWSNGEEVTANDFVYSWNRAADEKTAADYAYLFDIIARNDDGSLAVEATDDYTLKITLTNPCPYFNDLMAFPTYFPVYQKDVEKADPDGKNPGKWCQEAGFVSNGAYTLKSWKHNESMVYVKNPKYYDADNVTMDEIHIMLSADDTATYAAYNSGDLDFVDTVPNDEISTLNGKNSDFHIIPNLGTYYVGFNVNDPIFDGKTVEQAASMRKAMNLLIVEKADPDGKNPGKWCQEAGFVSNGAYTLKSWKHNESMVYVKNPKYYDADNVTMDEIHIMLSADDTATYAAYNSGDLDFVDTVPNDEISTLNGKNSDFHIIPNLGTYYVGFNVNDPIFDGKTVEQAASMRKAMNLLIDREFIVENVGQTGQIAADSFVPAGMSDGNGGVFKTDDTSYYDADKTGTDQVEEAKKLLESAGYTFTDNGDGSYKCDPAISMTFLTNDDSTHIAVGESLQQDFALLGINMEIKSEDWNVFIEDRKSGNFTIAREGWLADYNDPINMLELFTTDSGNNDMQLGKGDKPSDSAPDWTDYNKLIKEIRTTADFSKRVDLMHQAEDMLMDTGAVMPIYYYNDIYMLKSNIKGIYSTIYGMKYFMYATKDK